MSLTAFTGLLLGLAPGGSILLLLAALTGWKPTTRKRVSKGRGNTLWGSGARRRAVIALGAAVLVAALTGWPVAAGATAAAIYLWPTMFGGGKTATGQVERVEALATGPSHCVTPSPGRLASRTRSGTP
ncbi:hypothetical protein [Nocardioides sp. B-3]|uniref:hypothetical protein n=1 Tax=Nocardioides sp. B-3 TaxID=2895565 RepID=UPI00215218CB|nr:hypothetical protein [Nocardioides sp. B-3]UUZ59581.1 hypothetical protein LP418_28110 [Nocardioides sp. B-3]